ncbi:hypothetical protein DPMN_077890 [Dreissena polymorpha]|uniref:Uncharacterized protein n=1 Tax=Dreissena polymorpha TaxID=45954 RepID=A0A9D3YQ68_DREPO|nr:hypothetical protein DPMN_077890 [Dreissena polymorpha]
MHEETGAYSSSPLMLGKSSKAGRREVSARGPDYGYEKHITWLERQVYRIVNTNDFSRSSPSLPRFGTPQRAL